ncbi:hypothetical protein [Pseudomonas sp. NBRC 111124]|uniref:hypothetical protein n=1 Tax=Pseudomonas sp. NBRC 111124 TaxID=1661039 RepID=UPI0007619042|nr:hypothetical protein [Pseudomonas sp. NBRC 111124]
MSSYEFQPAKSFVAKLYWQPDDAPGNVSAVGDTGNGDSPFTSGGWLHADEDNYTNHWAAEHVIARRKFRTLFWFGGYETDGEWDFEIRAAQDEQNHPHWQRRNHRLDVSRNGYLALYSASEPAGHDPLAAASMLWRLEGLDMAKVKVGAFIANLRLVSLHGKIVKRLVEDDFPYLSEEQGQHGCLALKIVRTGCAAP